jgi:hypothetical protein
MSLILRKGFEYTYSTNPLRNLSVADKTILCSMLCAYGAKLDGVSVMDESLERVGKLAKKSAALATN